MKHEYFSKYLDAIYPDSVFVEIGGERSEGSTNFLWSLAKEFKTRLYTVDVVDKTYFGHLQEHWKIFYNKVKDASWPTDVKSLDDLPENLQKECIVNFNWADEEANVKQYTEKYNSDSLIAVQESGSAWSKSYGKNIGKPISLLYLDNFDYIWEGKQTSEAEQIRKFYLQEFDIELNNELCQLEHFAQLLSLEKNLAPGCLIGLDDTYLYNDCWIGKSGPGVVYLKTLGYETILHDQKSSFVLMKKPK